MSKPDLTERYRELLKNNRPHLELEIDIESGLISHLFSKKVISEREKQTVEAIRVEYKKIRKLLDILGKKRQNELEEFIKALIETDQQHIVSDCLTVEIEQSPEHQMDHDLLPEDVPDITVEEEFTPVENSDTTESTSDECHECSIEEAIYSERKGRYTLKGKVVKKSEVESYHKMDGSPVYFFTLIICDTTGVARIRIYHTSLFCKIKRGKSYTFTSVVRRAELFLFGGPSSYYRSPSVRAETMETKAKSLNFTLTDNMPRTLNVALEAINSSCVKGKILKVSPLKRMKSGTLYMRLLALIDSDDKPYVKVAVFQEEARKAYLPGGCVTISYVYPYKQKKESLSSTKQAEVQILEGEDCEELSKLSYTQQIDDPEFDEPEHEDIELLGVQNAGVYDFCANKSCSNKKVEEGEDCPECDGSLKEKSCWAHMVGIHQHVRKKFKAFKSELENVFELKPLEEYKDNEDLIDDICDEIEINPHITAVITGLQDDDRIITSVKRKYPDDD